MTLKIKKMRDDAILPTYNLGGDAALDLYALEDVILGLGCPMMVATGVAVAVPEGFVGLIWDRSGLSMVNGIKTLGGVIDSGYRGQVNVGLINLSEGMYSVSKGDKIAQMLIQRVERVKLEEVEVLAFTERGDKGFGSSGK